MMNVFQSLTNVVELEKYKVVFQTLITSIINGISILENTYE